MVSVNLKLTATKVKVNGGDGSLKKNELGYYRMPLGALNTVNSAGEYYVEKGSAKLFEQSGQLQRQIKAGNLKGEYGHPKRQVGMTEKQFLLRCSRVEEQSVAAHISSVELDYEYAKKYNMVKPVGLTPKQNKEVGVIVPIFGMICGSGPFGPALEKSLENPLENVCFSIRSFTVDYYVDGRTFRVLDEIITWDPVTEPGISTATKWDSDNKAIGLESFTFKSNTEMEMSLTKRDIGFLIEENVRMGLESKASSYEHLLKHFEQQKPISLGW